MDEPKKEKKETGGKPMDDLMRKLVQVPKAALDRNLRRQQATKRKKKK